MRQPRAELPHCDARVLHSDEICRVCAAFPELQRARRLWGINFTGETDPEKLPCPSEAMRPLSVIELWPGNRPVPQLAEFGGIVYQDGR